MPRYTGGDITEISCQHTLGDFKFAPKSNESYTLDRGGIRVNDDANQITGSGTAIYQKNRVRWMFEGPIAVDFDSDNEMSSLATLAAHPDEGIWTIVLITGDVYKGKGMPVGDLQPDTNAATMTLKISGSGQLEKL